MEEESKLISLLANVSPELFRYMTTTNDWSYAFYDAIDEQFRDLEDKYGDGRDAHVMRGFLHFPEDQEEDESED